MTDSELVEIFQQIHISVTGHNIFIVILHLVTTVPKGLMVSSHPTSSPALYGNELVLNV